VNLAEAELGRSFHRSSPEPYVSGRTVMVVLPWRHRPSTHAKPPLARLKETISQNVQDQLDEILGAGAVIFQCIDARLALVT